MHKTISSAETIVLLVILACFGASVVLSSQGYGEVAWGKFAFPYLCSLGLVVLGTFYRTSRNNDRIATVLIVTGLYVGFTNAGATLNYLLFSADAPKLDPLLMALDAMIGFEWAAFVMWFEGRQLLSDILGIVYQSSLLQLMLVIGLLGFTGRTRSLHEFMLVGVFSSVVSISIWAVAPSFGPAHIVELPAHLRDGLGLTVDADYIAHLRLIANNGSEVIEPLSLQGLIAFPSMHTVMAMMTVFYTRRTSLFPVFLAINILMLPAILLHGGHHLVDVLGGFAVFAFVVCAIRALGHAGAHLVPAPAYAGTGIAPTLGRDSVRDDPALSARAD
ncbi:phosphatase PAP2 family protein [Blastomonas sp.]|uniref:phosphatase PAP2 family protein n=1 Tax=Blastomonas sp. TaxID=1909299 RepID=UPI0026369778|nr:phosphatase PAP2 family protein [Blastomonas sp.]MDM7956171.1 phosphatase PAP2 family protein [Blastomonas sp.]